jgi:uncharacterized protein YbaP (TraB family)
MSARVSILFLCFIVLVSTKELSAQKYSNTLLWRISGNHLSAPSYLFGTMHMTDERLFRLSDSVYRAIEKSEGLAIEINPDEVGLYLVNNMFDAEIKSKSIREILGKKDYEKYQSALSKKLKKPADKITSADILKEKNGWMSEYMEKGEMPTFLDAYLYSLARKQGKWVGGIEDIGDQASVFDDVVDKSDIIATASYTKEKTDSAFEKMIRLYTSEDVGAIDTWANESGEEKDFSLTRRNVKMARRMDSLSAFRTMFFAVGAAHLAGDSGVIELLRQRGFTVTPVMSSRKLDPSQYKVTEVKRPWLAITDTSSAYKISLPANPVKRKLMGVVDMCFYFDIFSASAYWVMTVPTAQSIKNKDSVFNIMAVNILKDSKTYTTTNIKVNGIEGREYIDTGDNKLRIRVFLENNTFYAVMVSALKKSVLRSPETLQFLNSFAVTEPNSQPAGLAVFTDSIMGIRFLSPVKLSYEPSISNDKDDSWRIHGFIGNDTRSGSYVLLFSKEIKPGYYITNDSTVHSATMALFQKQANNVVVHSKELNGSPYKEFEGISNKQPGFSMRGVSFIRNGRNLLLMLISDTTSQGKAIADTLFGSVRLMEPLQANWQKRTTAAFSTWAPVDFKDIKSAQRSATTQLIAYDTTTSSSYLVLADTISNYFWTPSIQQYRNDVIKELEESGSGLVVSKKDRTEIGATGIEALLHTGNNLMYKRVGFFVSGNLQYRLILSGEKELVTSDNANRFFETFQLTNPSSDPFITRSKATLLMDDLASADSSVRYTAYNAIKDAAFSWQDSSLLYERMFRSYLSPYDNTLGNDINLALGKAAKKLKADQLLSFLDTTYRSFSKNGHEDKKSWVIEILAALQTKESFEKMAELLSHSPLRSVIDFRYDGGLDDSLALSRAIWPTLQHFVKDSILGLHIVTLISSLRDSSIDVITPTVQADLIVLAKKLLPLYKLPETFEYQIYTLLDLLAEIKTPAAYAAMKEYLAADNKFLRKKAVVLLLKNNQPVPAAVMSKLAADIRMRSTFYSDLKEINKTALFPAAYATQPLLAESEVFTQAEDNYEIEEPKLVFLTKKTASYKGVSYSFYLYKVIENYEEKTTYLGIAGGYKKGSTKPLPDTTLSGLYTESEFDASDIEGQLAAFLKGLAAEEEDEEEEIE